MERYEIRCTDKQKERAKDLGAPTEIENPTIGEMCRWLELEYNVFVNVYFMNGYEGTEWRFCGCVDDMNTQKEVWNKTFGTSEDAYLNTIDSALTFIENGREIKW